ncbi:MAG: alpha/beta hydrolase [Firmicutes bacterium]|nr:alpha/beta hydrolase [Bacillota bacterium]
MKKKWQKKLKNYTGLAMLATGAVAYGISDYFFRTAVLRNNQTPIKESKAPINSVSDKSGVEWLEEVGYDVWQIQSEDGLALRGYYIPAREKTEKTVILAHGYSVDATWMSDLAKAYHESFGFNVLMPDARAHGMSEGKYIGFGWMERIDYQLWIQRVISNGAGDARIVLHGVSMGAATVMMTSGEVLPSQVKAVIADCGYTSAYEQLKFRYQVEYAFPDWIALPGTNLLTKWRLGYDFTEASTIKQVKKNRLPMMFIHGEADTYVPYKMVFALYDACHTPKVLYTVPGAGHAKAFETAPESYMLQVKQFLEGRL